LIDHTHENRHTEVFERTRVTLAALFNPQIVKANLFPKLVCPE